jgi:5-methylcytosine-specific restriction endonuclease McrA
MIFLHRKDRDHPPLRLGVSGALEQIQRAITHADGNRYNHSYYPHEAITDLLRAYSIDKLILAPGDKPKCNYCESRIEHAATLQVEHYRPKALVSAGINDNLELPGYYWLGLEWTNLLLACPKCNGKDAKANKFPIRGTRAGFVNPIITLPGGGLLLDRTNIRVDSDTLADEHPILLNPEVDHPEDFLTFDIEGNMDGYGQNKERGDVSWQTYRLNRSELIVERLDILDGFRKKILDDISAFEMNVINENALNYYFKQTSIDIIARKSAEEEYTLWGRFVNDHINEFIQKYVPQSYHERFAIAYHAAVVAQQSNPIPVVDNQLLLPF